MTFAEAREFIRDKWRRSRRKRDKLKRAEARQKREAKFAAALAKGLANPVEVKDAEPDEVWRRDEKGLFFHRD